MAIIIPLRHVSEEAKNANTGIMRIFCCDVARRTAVRILRASVHCVPRYSAVHSARKTTWVGPHEVANDTIGSRDTTIVTRITHACKAVAIKPG